MPMHRDMKKQVRWTVEDAYKRIEMPQKMNYANLKFPTTIKTYRLTHFTSMPNRDFYHTH